MAGSGQASNGEKAQLSEPSSTASAFTVSAFLRQHKETIVRSWEARVTAEVSEIVRSGLALIELSGLALRDEVPGFLDELAAWLESHAPPELARLRLRAFEHVMPRLEQGLWLAQVFREYRLLREVLLATLLEAEAVEQGHAGAPGEAARVARIAELARLNAGLDGVLSQSIVEFVAERDRRAVEERERAGRLVHDSEAWYRSLFDSMDEGFCIVEVLFEAERPVDYVFLQVNHAFERHTGLAHAIGKRVREMLPGHEQYWFEIYGRVARTGEPARFENPAQALGRFYDVYAFRVGEPEQCQVAVLFNDITDRRRAEEAVRTSEEVKAFLLKLSDAIRPLADAGDIQTTAARKVRDHFEADRCFYCEIDGQTAIIRGDASRGDLPSVVGVHSMASFSLFKAALDVGRPLAVSDTRTTTAVDDDLRRLCLQMQIGSFLDVPVIKDGKPVGLLSIAQCTPRDWTGTEMELAVETAERTWAAVERARAEQDLRASEAKYKDLFETIEEMVSVHEVERNDGGEIIESRLREANPAFLHAVGADSVDEIRGRTCAEILGKAWCDQQSPAIQRAMATGQEQIQELYRPESDRHYVTSLVRLDPQTYLATGRDITERKWAEEGLQEANRQLGEADRRKNEFLAVLSHELRNPLAPITNSLYILDHAPPGGDQSERAKQVIGRQVAQLSSLVNDLLDVTRIASNKIQLHKESLELGEAVRRTVEDNRSLFDRAGIHLELLPGPSPVPVTADRTRLAQILGNLLQNSAKFTPKGGHTAVSVAVEGDAAIVRVADDGVGMSRETLERIFQPFVQAEQSLDRSKGGLGLGLALVRGLVELHGGTVSAHSEGVGRGAEMVARLPLDVGAAVDMTAPRAGESGVPRRILIIEDNVDAADSLREVLSFGGHAIEVAYNGPDGIKRARAVRPDIVLCDLGLPDMSGYEVAQAFRADAQLEGMFLVALSGYALPEDRQRSAEAGFQRHLAKPPSIEDLHALLRSIPPVGPDLGPSLQCG